MKHLLSIAIVTVYLPLALWTPARMNTQQAASLYERDQLAIIEKWEDGSARFTWEGTLYTGCIIPEYGCE